MAATPDDNDSRETASLQTPQTAADFSFPFTAYPIQLSFMQRLFECIESSSLAIFESPTGTGKSLSIICGALTWLLLNEARAAPTHSSPADSSLPDWVAEYQKKIMLEDDPASDLQHARERYAQWVSRVKRREAATRAAWRAAPRTGQKRARDSDDALSDAASADSTDSEGGSEPDEPITTKIIYASRTHSQLQQFVGELKRTAFASRDKIRVASLGSRTQLCISSDVRAKSNGSVGVLNELCAEMQQPGKRRCKYLPAQRTPMLEFAERAREHIMDIEDLVADGRAHAACAYYASRALVNAAHVVTLPYSTLLSRRAREASGIASLEGQVVIIDEAHNLIDSINAAHTHILDAAAADALVALLKAYFSRYWRRLSTANSASIRLALAFLKAVRRFMERVRDASVLSVNAFLHAANADHINVYRVAQYLRDSHIGRKLNAFVDGDANERRVSPVAAIAAFGAFVEAVAQPDYAGARVLVSHDAVKYLLLDPSEPFAELCVQARAVVLAGGTMKPTHDTLAQLVPHSDSPEPKLDIRNARVHAWGHVVDASHVCALAVRAGPTNAPLNFSYANRDRPEMLDEAGRALAGVVRVVPAGVVVFFPSYAVLAHACREWEASGVMRALGAHKRVFVERAGECANVFEEYAKEVRARAAGAVLLSVVGGRLSEGINFADELGRAVVMVGVPYPNIKSVELRERIMHFQGSNGEFAMNDRGRRLYDALCMRAVNQAVGRVVRHKGDYAAVVFLDVRYGNECISRLLPEWLTGGAQSMVPVSFGSAVKRISAFFKSAGGGFH